MNDNKTLAFDVNKCTGCRACETRCSFKHFRVINPARSRIRVMKLEEVGINMAIFLCSRGGTETKIALETRQQLRGIRENEKFYLC